MNLLDKELPIINWVNFLCYWGFLLFSMRAFEYSFVIKHSDGSNVTFPVEFVRSLKAKSIKITPQLVKKVIRVTYPVYVLRSRAVDFLEKQKDWIAKQLEKVPEEVKICDGAKITFLEKEYKIMNIPNARRGVWFEDAYIFVSGDVEFLNRRVKDFLKEEMKRYLTEKVRYYAKKIGRNFSRVTVKDTVSRWGSCTNTGNLSFSWRLGFAPLFVVDYIVAHEVTHLSYMNHSSDFWRMVKRICDSNVDEAQDWLARNGIYLYSID